MQSSARRDVIWRDSRQHTSHNGANISRDKDKRNAETLLRTSSHNSARTTRPRWTHLGLNNEIARFILQRV